MWKTKAMIAAYLFNWGTIMLKTISMIAGFALAALPAMSATYTGTVTTTEVAISDTGYGGIGEPAAASFDGSAFSINGANFSFDHTWTGTTPTNDGFSDFFEVTDSTARYVTSSGTMSLPFLDAPTHRSSLLITFGVPVTVAGSLSASLESAGTTLAFSASGSVIYTLLPPGIGQENPSENLVYDAFLTSDVSATVPLPAGGVLLVSGLALLAARRRKS